MLSNKIQTFNFEQGTQVRQYIQEFLEKHPCMQNSNFIEKLDEVLGDAKEYESSFLRDMDSQQEGNTHCDVLQARIQKAITLVNAFYRLLNSQINFKIYLQKPLKEDSEKQYIKNFGLEIVQPHRDWEKHIFQDSTHTYRLLAQDYQGNNIGSGLATKEKMIDKGVTDKKLYLQSTGSCIKLECDELNESTRDLEKIKDAFMEILTVLLGKANDVRKNRQRVVTELELKQVSSTKEQLSKVMLNF